MRFQLLISCNNAAFGDTKEETTHEVARILARAAEAVADTHYALADERTLRDANGNTVGTWAFVDE